MVTLSAGRANTPDASSMLFESVYCAVPRNAANRPLNVTVTASVRLSPVDWISKTFSRDGSGRWSDPGNGAFTSRARNTCAVRRRRYSAVTVLRPPIGRSTLALACAVRGNSSELASVHCAAGPPAIAPAGGGTGYDGLVIAISRRPVGPKSSDRPSASCGSAW